MTTLETRRYTMLARVRDFGEAHKDLFPEASEGGQAFATVATAVAKLGTHARSKLSGTRNGKQAKVAARDALRDRLDAIARTARAIGERTPGFDDPFRLPRKQDDDALLLACPMFIDEAEAKQERFIRHGLSETFIADLKALVERFAQAVRAVAAAKEGAKVGRKGIAAAELSGLAAVRQLDVIVANQLEHDPDALAHWEEARRIEYPYRRRSVASPELPPPATPSLPALSATTAPAIATSASPGSDAPAAEGDAGQSHAADLALPKAS
jgi:hypothetical protein